MNQPTEEQTEFAASAITGAGNSGEYTLTEEGVRRYIGNKGGRVSMRDVVEVVVAVFHFVYIFLKKSRVCILARRLSIKRRDTQRPRHLGREELLTHKLERRGIIQKLICL